MAWYSRFEREVARWVGGRRHAGSGSTWWQKGDASTDDVLVEVKARRARAYYVSPKVWNRLLEQAELEGKRPVLVVVLCPAPGIQEVVRVEGLGRIERGFTVRADK